MHVHVLVYITENKTDGQLISLSLLTSNVLTHFMSQKYNAFSF